MNGPHTDLVFHGRRFEIQYCVACHNPGLADGEGDETCTLCHGPGKVADQSVVHGL